MEIGVQVQQSEAWCRLSSKICSFPNTPFKEQTRYRSLQHIDSFEAEDSRLTGHFYTTLFAI